MDIYLDNYLVNSAYLGLFIIVLLAAKWVYNLTTPYDTVKQLSEHRNTSLAISISGYLFAVSIIYFCVLAGPSQGLLNDLINVSIYSALGMALLVLSRWINDKFLLHAFCNTEQLIDKQNLATGIAQAASYLSSSLLIGGALAGEGSWLSAVVFYLLGQALLTLFARLYDYLTQFDVQEQLQEQNLAAAVSFSATLIAVGVILFHAVSGQFISWQQSLALFAVDSAIAFLVLPFMRLLVDKVLLPNIVLDTAIAERNIAVALIEGSLAICVALAILVAL